jgi:glutathione S-transferase
MQLYFAPLACSLATRIVFYDAEAQADYIQVDLKQKRLPNGEDFREINPLGQVPVLRLDDGSLLRENTAILQYVGECFPNAELMPGVGAEQARVRQWLGFIGTELHKGIYVPLLDPRASDAAKEYARSHLSSRMDLLETHLWENKFLVKRFTVADAYLVTILNWSSACNIDLKPWGVVSDYFARVRQRPSVTRAMTEEFALYQQERQRANA